MTVLVVGHRGQTGRAIAEGLQRASVSVRGASARELANHDAVLRNVRAVYMIAPPLDSAPERTMCPFIDRALMAGVNRFVLLGSSAIEEDEPGLGRVHRHLRDRAPEWAVLRPSWFMQNFVNPQHVHAQSLAAGEPMITATGRGKIAFIDAGDIARTAVRLLIDTRIRNADYVLTGPEALAFDDVAAIFREHTGRPTSHRSVSPAELVDRWTAGGMPAEYANLLAALDERVARGSEARTTRVVEEITGEPPRSFAAFVAATSPKRSTPLRP